MAGMSRLEQAKIPSLSRARVAYHLTMRIAHLTAGTGNFHCGNCHRDNTLVRALRSAGHDAYLVPLYLPLVLDEPAASPQAPLFAGGINMFLQQKAGVFRHTPRWLDGILDSRGLLRLASKFAGMTRAKDLGEMTVGTLDGVASRQRKEWERMIEWLTPLEPEVVALSNGLLAGLAQGIKERLGCAVICSLQGEDAFLDSLPEPYRGRAWEAMAATAAHVDRFIGVSEYYSTEMARRMNLPPEKVTTVRNGIDLSGLSPARSRPELPTIGFLSRLCHGKGLHLLADAFILLKERANIPGLRLRLGGAMTSVDDSFVAEQMTKLAAAGVAANTEWCPNLDAAAKIEFLQSLSVLSVPAIYGEAFGLFVLEALACAVPVVQPDHAAFPELIRATGGGVLCPPNHAPALAVAIEQLLLTPGLAAELGARGRAAVERQFSAERMARDFAEVCAGAVAATPAVPG
jgi:glycosyltransferase involved in cell wall biosynthesis